MLARLDVPGHEFQRASPDTAFSRTGYATSVYLRWPTIGSIAESVQTMWFIEQVAGPESSNHAHGGCVQSNNLRCSLCRFQKLGGFWHESFFKNAVHGWLIKLSEYSGSCRTHAERHPVYECMDDENTSQNSGREQKARNDSRHAHE